MKEFEEHYFPNAYRQETLFRKVEDPENLGDSMAEDFLDKIKREIQRARS